MLESGQSEKAIGFAFELKKKYQKKIDFYKGELEERIDLTEVKSFKAIEESEESKEFNNELIYESSDESRVVPRREAEREAKVEENQKINSLFELKKKVRFLKKDSHLHMLDVLLAFESLGTLEEKIESLERKIQFFYDFNRE